MLDIDDADGLNTKPDKNGFLHLGGSFNCTCDKKLVIDNHFNPKNLDPIFALYDSSNKEIDYDVVEIGLCIYTNNHNRLYFKDRPPY